MSLFDKLINKRIIIGAILILLGVLIIIFKSYTFTYSCYLFGLLLIALGIIDIIKGKTSIGTFKIAIGFIIGLFPWIKSFLIIIACFAIGFILIIYGIYKLRLNLQLINYCERSWDKMILLLFPIFLFFLGALFITGGFINNNIIFNIIYYVLGSVLIIIGLFIVIKKDNKIIKGVS